MAAKAKEEPAAKFTKQQLAGSKTFANMRDIINAVLKDGETYTVEAAKAAVNKYMEGVVY